MRKLFALVVLLLIGAAISIALWPVPSVMPKQAFDPRTIGANIDAYLTVQEAAQIEPITAGVEKQMVWAGVPGEKTRISLIYLHGWSATSREMHPVPERVAWGLGANLYLPRLAGHGQSGEAFADATADQWMTDLHEAMEIGRLTGEKIVIISASTGSSLATMAATDPAYADVLAGVVMVAPNFGVKARGSSLLFWPYAPKWAHLIMGETRNFEPISEDHGTYWTTSYPSRAVFPLSHMYHAARQADHSAAKMPAYFIYSQKDEVVSAKEIVAVRDAWGGDVSEWVIEPGTGIDPANHNLLGDIRSPALTEEGVTRMIEWIVGL